MQKPAFSTLWSKYSSQNHACSMSLPNQCAIRMSRALIAAGWTSDVFKSPRYGGKLCPHGLARGAQALVTGDVVVDEGRAQAAVGELEHKQETVAARARAEARPPPLLPRRSASELAAVFAPLWRRLAFFCASLRTRRRPLRGLSNGCAVWLPPQSLSQ